MECAASASSQMDEDSTPRSLDELPADVLLLILDQIHNDALLAFALTCATCREGQRRSQRPLRTSARAVVRSAALLRWAHDELNFECDESTFAQVARTGDITMLEQLRSWDVPCDARACAAAAAGGHLDALQWLRAADCRWDVQTMIEAAEAGEFKILEWGRANFAPVDSWVCAGAAIAGRLDVVQWCRKRLLPWGDDTVAGAVAARHGHVVLWCLDHGCPCRGGTRVQAQTFLSRCFAEDLSRRALLEHFAPHQEAWEEELAARFEGLVS